MKWTCGGDESDFGEGTPHRSRIKDSNHALAAKPSMHAAPPFKLDQFRETLKTNRLLFVSPLSAKHEEVHYYQKKKQSYINIHMKLD